MLQAPMSHFLQDPQQCVYPSHALAQMPSTQLLLQPAQGLQSVLYAPQVVSQPSVFVVDPQGPPHTQVFAQQQQQPYQQQQQQQQQQMHTVYLTGSNAAHSPHILSCPAPATAAPLLLHTHTNPLAQAHPHVQTQTQAHTQTHVPHQQPSVFMDPSLPRGWVAVCDPGTGRTYYWHTESNSTSWIKPVVSPSVAAAPAVPVQVGVVAPHNAQTHLVLPSPLTSCENSVASNARSVSHHQPHTHTVVVSEQQHHHHHHHHQQQQQQRQRQRQEPQKIWTNFNNASFYAIGPSSSQFSLPSPTTASANTSTASYPTQTSTSPQTSFYLAQPQQQQTQPTQYVLVSNAPAQQASPLNGSNVVMVQQPPQRTVQYVQLPAQQRL